MIERVRALAWRAGWPVRALVLGAIRAYRLTLAGVLGGQCRFHPTCSAYAEEAVRELGVLRGVPLSGWRVLRCSPLSAGGVDYPPGRGLRLANDAVIRMEHANGDAA